MPCNGKFKRTSPDQRNLLREIKAKWNEILQHEKEVESFQLEERFDAANDEKAVASLLTEELKGLLEKAKDLGMNAAHFPLVEELYEKLVTIPRQRLAMASGSGQH